MIKLKYTKNNIINIYCDDEFNDLNKIYDEYKIDKDILKKVVDSNEFSYTEIQHDPIIRIFNTEITLMANDFNKFVTEINNLFEIYTIYLNDYKFTSPLTMVNPKVIKDGYGDKLIINQNDINEKDLTTFIYRMKKDNGKILSPLVNRFSRTAYLLNNNRRAILGYAHLPTYFRLLKNDMYENYYPFISIDKNDYIINIKSTLSFFTLKIDNEGDNNPVIRVNIDGVEISKKKLDSKGDPYLIVGTRPIDVNGLKLPFFVVKERSFNNFCSVLVFKDDSFLSNMKGGINLLKF